MNNDLDRVVPLDDLDDFKVADGDPDVRGWNVMGSDGRKIGEVDNLLIDTAAMKVRYLDVDLDDDLIDTDMDDDRHVLIPIGYARLDRDDDNIFVDALESSAVAGLPAYGNERLTRDYETKLRTHFDRDYTAAAVKKDNDNDDFYDHDHYDENRFYGREDDSARMTLSEEEVAVGKRQHAAGAVEVEKQVVTEHVRKEVPVSHDEVTIERRPISGMAAGDTRIEEGEVRIPLTEEEVVVEKRVVPKEELVVKKHTVTDTQVVEADVRKERAVVEREGDVDIREERKR